MREGWEYKKLGDVCQPKSNIERATKCFSSSDRIEYVDISSIDNLTNKIIASTSYRMDEAPSRAQQKVCLGDIIISTVRPNLKNVAKVDKEMDNLVVSSGFCVLRTNDSVVDNYIYHYVSSDLFANHLMKLSTGANYPAVRDKDVRDSVIPVPAKSTQLDIVAELDQINDLIRLKKELLKEYDNLAQSIFYDMFGDPVVNEKDWEVRKLCDVCTKITDGTHDTPKRLTSGVKFITGKHIRPFRIDYDNSDYVTEEVHREIYKRCNPEYGDVLYTNIGANFAIAAVNIVTYEFSMKNVALLKFDNDITGFYVQYVLNFESMHSKIVENFGKGGAQNFLSLKQINSICIPLPPLPLQQEFSSRIEQIEKLKAEVQKTITDLETLLASRMQYWFE